MILNGTTWDQKRRQSVYCICSSWMFFFQTTGKKIRVKRTWLISLHELNLEYVTDDNFSIDSGDDFRSGVTSGSKPYTGESKGSYCLSNICEDQLIFHCIVQQEKKLPLSTISTFCLTVPGLFTRSSKFWEFFWLVDFLFAITKLPLSSHVSSNWLMHVISRLV